ncbi:hypothetical protein SJAV_21530 [Sulfurisphaera javensis]|uniref:Uncharacterized protein n=1 Tax=Sulfurisphaera javensis TaxID=2049879 RepID=A0AAT9GTJ4_9CREN
MRKTLGIYYGTWVIYFLFINLVNYVESLYTSNNVIFTLTDIVIVVPFIIYSVYIFGKIIRLRLIRFGYNNRYFQITRIFYSLYYTILIIIFMITFDQWYSIIPILLFTAGISFAIWRILFSRYKLTKGKYYDILAIGSFQLYPLYPILAATSFSKFATIYVFIFAILWAYASIKSFLELIDNGEYQRC